jgi:hypothetical protein
MPQSGAPRVPGIVEQVALAFRDQRAGDLVVRQHCSSLLVSRSSCAVFARYCKGSSDPAFGLPRLQRRRMPGPAAREDAGKGRRAIELSHGEPIPQDPRKAWSVKQPTSRDRRVALLVNEIRRVHAENFGVYGAGGVAAAAA